MSLYSENLLLTNQQKKMDTVYDLPADTLKRIYLGQKKGRLLILNFQRISSGLFRVQVRDLVSNDHLSVNQSPKCQP